MESKWKEFCESWLADEPDVLTVLEIKRITYAEAEFNARVKIYQSINLSFNPDVEFAKDPICRDIPSVDNSLFAIARKLILESK